MDYQPRNQNPNQFHQGPGGPNGFQGQMRPPPHMQPRPNMMSPRPFHQMPNGNFQGPPGGPPGGHPGHNPGFQNHHPLRPIPPHMQRPPFEQPMLAHPKSQNPLDDLVETEKEYVGDLKILLQRVSAGWTHDDFPPKEIDVLLRNIEEIHAVNRKFSKKLQDVVGSGDMLKDLGAVLMWFVDSMESSYSNYCRSHVPHLDNWPEIINNSRLQNILTEIAAEQVQHVTLDTFLMKPIERLQYYRRLYMRLLDSSERGNPDFDSLEAAFMRIDTILRFVTVDVPGTARHPASPALSGISSMSALRNALPSPPIGDQHQASPNFPPQQQQHQQQQQQRRMDNPNGPNSPALPPSPMSPGVGPNGQRPSRTAAAMLDLEKTLDTSQVLDLFTMQPKTCALSLALVERDIVLRGDFYYTILADEEGDAEVFKDGHVLLLSDLLLLCRQKSPDEMDQNPPGDESDLFLVFPPLAIRHVVAKDGTTDPDDPVVELSIVNRVKARVYVQDEALRDDWIADTNGAQLADSAKASQLSAQNLNRNQSQGGPVGRPPMGPGSPLSPNFQQDFQHGGRPPFNGPGGPMSPGFNGPRPGMGGPLSPGFGGPGMGPGGPGMGPGGPMGPGMGGPMMGPGGPGFRPHGPPGGMMGRPPMMMGGGPGPGPGGPPHMMMGGPPMRPSRPMSMRRNNTIGRSNTAGGRPLVRGRTINQGDAAAAKETMYKSKPCDVFQWKDEDWEPLVEDDDCIVELRLTTAHRLCMAATTLESRQLVLIAWVVASTTFRRSSDTDVSVSIDMGASVQWFLVAMNTAREADEFCHAFQQTYDRALYDPNLQKSVAPILSRGESLASTVSQKTVTKEKVVRQTLTSMYPPSECKLLLQAGDHGQWVNLGSARCEIKQEKPSGHVRLSVDMDKNKRVINNVIVQCDCLELVSTKRLAITLMNPQEKLSIIYMLQFKDEVTATKLFNGLSLNQNE